MYIFLAIATRLVRVLDPLLQAQSDFNSEGLLPPSPMRIVFIELRHFVISSMALFFSDGTSIRDILSRTERTRSCGVFGRFERLNRKAMLSPRESNRNYLSVRNSAVARCSGVYFMGNCA
jgi:hypothetical protein